VFLGFKQATVHPSVPWIQPSHRPPQCTLDSTKSLATPVLLGFNQITDHPSAPWNQPNHRPPQCSLESTKPTATLVFLRFNQATGHPSAPWIQPSHRPPQRILDSTKPSATPMLLGFNQATGHPNVLWIQPSHRPPQCSFGLIQVTGPPRCSLGLIQAIGPSWCSLGLSKLAVHPSAPLDYPSHWFIPVGVVILHCTRLQCSLHFCAYTLAMQSMVSAFIQHPSTYPSRYIILIWAWNDDNEQLTKEKTMVWWDDHIHIVVVG
jgi:hypothetical protein